MKTIPFLSLVMVGLLLSLPMDAQRRGSKASPAPTPIDASLFDDYKLRNIGPAFMSGRIADMAIDPDNESTWYIAVGSGGVWKTTNAGTTFEPLFDAQAVFSIGCVTIDPHNPHRIWVGTGENVGGRHASFGDGVYLSEDDGATWTNMGLPQSEHISRIVIHPDDPNTIMVAAQGPLWSAGGERGFYKSTDGGKSWNKTLGDSEYTGVTDFVVDPRDPDRIIAATWQHHRTVAAWMGGGEKTRLHLSTDGGDTWIQLSKGLPEGKMGKIGLAISPQNPDVVYAAIELNRTKGGFYRSTDRGMSWTKMSDKVAGATGPHYYQEIFASPHQFDRIYFMDNRLWVTEDGGATFTEVNTEARHGDNHAIAFKPSDPDYLMVGTDGGVYESHDLGAHWRYMENLPITQFYKLAVDDAAPFYNIYGGTQDNSTEGGPSRTDNVTGIRNSDWQVVLNWDGHQPATEPGNPNIMYGERQEGNLSRIDLKTGEVVDIQPQPGPEEDHERFNWDAPILVSPHDPATLFFASHRVWKSENRGDSWTAISPDLTRNEERIELPIMGRQQSWDAPWDVNAMSEYNTITSLAQSPINADILYAGTDDGLLQVSSDGGANWKRIEVRTLGVPATAFINDVRADLYDENTVYVALDNHKYGDYRPYFVKSTDKGATWTKLTNGLGTKNMVWRMVQDHVNKDLLFLGTEFGLFFTVDGGASWTELNGGVPTISFRDVTIQRRENDLVAASFGRGFFLIDDYTALRDVSREQLGKEATLFTPRKAWWYIPRSAIDFDDIRGSQGAQLYVAPNPDFGAVFTYYLKDGYQSAEAQRQEREEGMSGNIRFGGYEAMETESREEGPFVYLEIKDSKGTVVRRVSASAEKGFHRVAWDLQVAEPDILLLNGSEEDPGNGLMVAPGTYSATLYKEVQGKISPISEAVDVVVEPLREGTLEGADHATVAAFWREYEEVGHDFSQLNVALGKAIQTAEKLQVAAKRSTVSSSQLEAVNALRDEVLGLQSQLYGNMARNQIGEKNPPTIGSRLFAINRGVTRSTYGPTATHREQMQIVKEQLQNLNSQLDATTAKMNTLIDAVRAAGGPWIEK